MESPEFVCGLIACPWGAVYLDVDKYSAGMSYRGELLRRTGQRNRQQFANLLTMTSCSCIGEKLSQHPINFETTW